MSIKKTESQSEPKVHQAYDMGFKSAMSDLRVAKDILKHHLPEIVQQKIKLDTLKLESGTFVDPELRALHTDMLYSVELKAEKEGNIQAFIYLHIEHQSEPDPLMSWRIIKYCARIIERHLLNHGGTTLPVVIPTVLYNGDKSYPHSLSIFDLFGENKALAQKFMFNQFHLVDLNTISDEEIRSHEWSCLLETLFKHIHARDIMEQLEQMSAVFQRLLSSHADTYVMSMLKFILEKGSILDREQFLAWITRNLPKNLEKEAMTLAEQWKEEGFHNGVLQGMQQGALNEERTILMRLLTRRFGSVSSQYVEKIESASTDNLLHWIEKVLDAKNIDEVFNFYS